MMYLIEYKRGYETYHADDYQHALDQANDANPDEWIINVFQCIELGEDGLAVFPHEADDLCSHNGGDSVTGAVIICDICGRRQDDSPSILYQTLPDWNGATGNHKSCEEDYPERGEYYAQKNAGIATCDICGQSNDHKHDASEYDVGGLEKALYEGKYDL